MECPIGENEAANAAKQCFLEKDYENAKFFYEAAIKANPSNSFYHSNLGMCFFFSCHIREAVSHFELALEISSVNIKAMVYYVKCIVILCKSDFNMSSLELASHLMQKAYNLCQTPQNSQYLSAITTLYSKFFLFKTFKLEEHKEHLQNSLKSYYKQFNSVQINFYLEKFLNFAITREIPEPLTCPITLQLLEHPIITPSGNSYEAECFYKYCKEKGYQDPLTREKFSPLQVLENKNISMAVKLFEQQHIWVRFSEKKSDEIDI